MTIIADDFTIINTQGIRFVEKKDQSWGDVAAYYLHVTYKGSALIYKYPSAQARDEQYDRLRQALTPTPAPRVG
jgi:hypothetical protein